MFTKFRICNFRTHVDTIIEPKDLTLLIGSNNSGKTNLLEGLRFFSELVKNSNPENPNPKSLGDLDVWNNGHALLGFFSPMSFECTYTSPLTVDYKLQIKRTPLESEREVKEFISLKSGYNEPFEQSVGGNKNLRLWTHLDNIKKGRLELDIFKSLLFDISNFIYFHFQPNVLKKHSQNRLDSYRTNFSIEHVIRELHIDQSNFLPILNFLRSKNPTEYTKFLAYLKRFEPSCMGIDESNQWLFDMGNGQLYSVKSNNISDGLIKAAAIALVCVAAPFSSCRLIMLEEIENGINQRNLSEFINWLRGVSDGGKNIQFILTTHSPSVIREFADHLDAVYNVHLKKKKGYVSDVTNMNESFKQLLRMGTLDENAIDEEDGVVHVRPYYLTELFYNGTLGTL